MAPLRSDRRLFFTADRSQMVEESDPRAAFLAFPEGRHIHAEDVEKYGLSYKDGRVVLADKAVSVGTVKDMPAPEEKSEAPEWTLSMSPEDYLERYGDDAKNSALARSVIEAEG